MMTIGLPAAPKSATPGQSPAPAGDQRAALHQAAGQFEALFVAQMLHSIRESAEADAEESSSAMRDIADEQFAQALAQGGGLGLAQTIEASFTPVSGPPASQP